MVSCSDCEAWATREVLAAADAECASDRNGIGCPFAFGVYCVSNVCFGFSVFVGLIGVYGFPTFVLGLMLSLGFIGHNVSTVALGSLGVSDSSRAGVNAG